jgi:integrase
MGCGFGKTKMRTGKLTALEVTRAVKARKVGMLNDGGGLYLKGGSSWIYRYALNGRKRDLGLGPALDIGLADARGRAAEARRLRLDGKDPIEARRASRAALAPATTFAQAAEAYMEAHRAGWRSEKHRRQWESSLASFVYPVIGSMAVGAIGVTDVLRVLKPIWQEKPETGSRVRNRIELVLDAAKARGLRSGENPAAWRGHLDKLLPRRSKMGAVQHFAALDYHEIAGFMTELRQQQGPAPRALEFAILTATRSGEAMGATWDEIDLDAKAWTIPAERTKARKEHRVPLSDPALAVLSEMATIRMSDFVFPGQRGQLSHRMLQLALTRIRSDVTVHGFRSSFRDWAGNETHASRELCEQALGHVVGNSTEQAYRRSDALEQRRMLMAAWAAHCEHQGGAVVPLRRAR